ncbi:ATP-grasp domain-containing protein [Gorillibacterium massiliense]|uniref:ATP-grasp domain-containing protein n=1 Tax=Gorillibacterium massiliense TaxID=1280390 RepID=UPI0004B1B644|nr:ATP-grasp domain-containing protein [Gorillibacterium massiliense]
MSAFNILFTSAGRRVSLIKYIKDALVQLSPEGTIVTADKQKTAPAAFVGDVHEILPEAAEAAYIPKLLEICIKHDIKLVIPLIDTELQVLADHRSEFEKISVCVLVSSSETIRICSDKRNTAAFFRKIQVTSTDSLDVQQILSDPIASYPYIIKPAFGSGSVGVTSINNAEELAFFLKYIPEPILQKYIKAREYTVDVLMDFAGKAYAAVPRLRMETRAGEVSKGMTVKDRRIISEAKKVAEALPGAIGCITIQCFVTEAGQIIFNEINPRFGGGVPLTLAAGAKYPESIIQWLLKMPLTWTDTDNWTDGLVMLRYDDSFFIDCGRVIT